MTLAVYSNSHRTTKHRPLPGTLHRGWPWTAAVRTLRAATQNAHAHADPGKPISVNDLGMEIIDLLPELDTRSRHVLRVVVAALVRWSRHGRCV